MWGEGAGGRVVLKTLLERGYGSERGRWCVSGVREEEKEKLESEVFFDKFCSLSF
jgi:hypothetical protein